jgi:RNA polymerase-binding transcription factor DksA
MAKKEVNKNRLTPAEIRQSKALLLAKLNEILKNVICMEEETLRRPRTDLSSMPIHMADVGTDTYEIENTLGLMDSERKLLLEIQDALGRIENGTYGICEGNNEPIPKERLRAIPWARYCVACASLSEKGLLVREYSVDESDYNDKANEEQNNDFDSSPNE